MAWRSASSFNVSSLFAHHEQVTPGEQYSTYSFQSTRRTGIEFHDEPRGMFVSGSDDVTACELTVHGLDGGPDDASDVPIHLEVDEFEGEKALPAFELFCAGRELTRASPPAVVEPIVAVRRDFS